MAINNLELPEWYKLSVRVHVLSLALLLVAPVLASFKLPLAGYASLTLAVQVAVSTQRC